MPDVPQPKMRERLIDIDQAKGLAIILVVFGHLVMRDVPTGNDWFLTLRHAIYLFHMPFFIYLSGIVMFYTGIAQVTPATYRDFVSKKAFRFLLPFMILGLLICFGKIFASHFIHVDNGDHGILSGLKALFWDTHDSPATSLWYIFVVFIFCVIVPPLMWLARQKIQYVLLFSFLIYFLPVPEYLFLDKAAHFLIFFVLGGCAVLDLPHYREILDKYKWIFIALFAFSFSVMLFDIPKSVLSIVIFLNGLISLPAIHALIRLPYFYNSKILQILSRYTFVIYLFNTILIGVAKGFMMKFIMPWDGINFLLYVPVLFGAGLIGPILFKEIMLKRNKFLDKITN